MRRYFFFQCLTDAFLSTFFSTLFRQLGKGTSRSYATEARRVLPPQQQNLAALTGGIHKDNHPALVDPAITNPNNIDEILYQGQPTHGKGSPQNPSMPLHPSRDLVGNARSQYYVPPNNIVYAPNNY